MTKINQSSGRCILIVEHTRVTSQVYVFLHLRRTIRFLRSKVTNIKLPV